MSTERVTISLPSDVRQATQRIAESSGVAFSAVVNDALASWLRSKLVDAWLVDYEIEHGVFDEGELRSLASEAGIPYLPPTKRSEAA